MGKLIDNKVMNLITTPYNRVINILTERIDELKELVQLLLEKEVAHKTNLEEVLGKRKAKELLKTEELKLYLKNKVIIVTGEGSDIGSTLLKWLRRSIYNV